VNVHHLELFYHVVRNRGISRAIGHMPFGIQQPALSEQIKLLEDDLGTKLFDRQPFRLTAAGHELYTFARPFFEDLQRLAPKLRNRAHRVIRVASDEMMIQQYIGPVLQAMRQAQPNVQLSLRSGSGEPMLGWLREGEVDLVITAIDGQRPHGLAYELIASRRLTLVVGKKTAIRSASHLWSGPQITHSLISPCATDGISQVFQRGLKQGNLLWAPETVASSAGTIAPSVASGAGVGVTLEVPYLVCHPQVRALRLDGFDLVKIAALWRPEDNGNLGVLLSVIRQCVAKEI
jgi:DNA-binding transcriptional LysR family regulator